MKAGLVNIGGHPRVVLSEGNRSAVLKADVPLERIFSKAPHIQAFDALIDPGIDGTKAMQAEQLPPCLATSKIICVGLNYKAHADESQLATTTCPTLFLRTSSSVVGANQPVKRPDFTDSLDYEGEMVVVIGQDCKDANPVQASECIYGYTIFNDFSVREYQMLTSQWMLGKNFDGTGACGPYIVTKDEIPANGKGLDLTTTVNGETVQSSNTDLMLHDVPSLICLISKVMQLRAGDLIVTGTPSGVGWAATPPRTLQRGDRCEVTIDRLGSLVNEIR